MAYSQPCFLILIKAPAVDFGFINSSVPVTGSFWNGYGGRVVHVPATLFFDAQRCPCKTASILLADCSPIRRAVCSWAIAAGHCTMSTANLARGAGRRSNGSAAALDSNRSVLRRWG